MRAPAIRSQRLALGVAVLTAAALGTVGAAAAQASGTSTATVERGVVQEKGSVSVVQEEGKGEERGNARGKDTEPPKGAGFAVAYRPTADAPGDVNAANDDFAACMRERGRSAFPVFHASEDAEGRVLLNTKITGGGFDPASKAYEKALKSCGPILAEVGITFPAVPDLPVPARPGEAGKGGPPALTSAGTEVWKAAKA